MSPGEGYQIDVLRGKKTWFSISPDDPTSESSLAIIYPIIQRAFGKGYSLEVSYRRMEKVKIDAVAVSVIIANFKGGGTRLKARVQVDCPPGSCIQVRDSLEKMSRKNQ